MKLANEKGTVFYGMHFYPGVAEYREPGKGTFRVFLNETTIRSMGPTFAGRPVFVRHVDDVERNVDELRKDADGWVIESFFNDADGKHWVKFLVVSEAGMKAVGDGFKLSNAYIPTRMGKGGEWNAVSYDKEILAGEYEHLALVDNPRYAESVVMTPDQFKAYNDRLRDELKRLENSKDEKGTGMKLDFFKRAKLENSKDMEGVEVVLPKSGRTALISTLVNELDAIEVKKGEKQYATGLVKVGAKEMTVEALVNAYEAKCNEDEEKENADDDGEDEEMENAEDDEEKKENEDEEDEDKKEAEALKKKEQAKKKNKKKNSVDDRSDEQKAKDKKAGDKLRNAHRESAAVAPVFESMERQVQRGKDLF